VPLGGLRGSNPFTHGHAMLAIKKQRASFYCLGNIKLAGGRKYP
jgi:hypothetical protein